MVCIRSNTSGTQTRAFLSLANVCSESICAILFLLASPYCGWSLAESHRQTQAASKDCRRCPCRRCLTSSLRVVGTARFGPQAPFQAVPGPVQGPQRRLRHQTPSLLLWSRMAQLLQALRPNPQDQHQPAVGQLTWAHRRRSQRCRREVTVEMCPRWPWWRRTLQVRVSWSLFCRPGMAGESIDSIPPAGNGRTGVCGGSVLRPLNPSGHPWASAGQYECKPPATEACLPTAAEFSHRFDEGGHGSWQLYGHLICSLLPAAADSNNPFGDGEVRSPSSASSRQGPATHSPRPLRRSLAESKPKKLDSSTPPTGRRPLFRVSIYPCLSWHTTGGRRQRVLRRGRSQGKCVAGAVEGDTGLSPVKRPLDGQPDTQGWQPLRSVCAVLGTLFDILHSQPRPCSFATYSCSQDTFVVPFTRPLSCMIL